MKKTILILLILTMVFPVFSQTVKLKITYKGKGISGHKVNLYMLGNQMSSGNTDENGEVSFKVSKILTKSVDLKGSKKCDGGQKSWDVKGFVTLDNNNYAHFKMETIIKEMVEASGGFMSEKLMASSYGLVCGGASKSSTSNKSTESSNKTSVIDDAFKVKEAVSPLLSKEEILKNKVSYLEGKIIKIEKKITKNKDKIADGKYKGKKKNEALYDIKELKIEKQIEENKLAKAELELKNGKLSRAQKKQFKNKSSLLKEDFKKLERDREKGVSLISEEEKNSEFEYSESELLNMNILELKKEKINLQLKLNKSKLKLKMKKRLMSPKKIAILESEIIAQEKGVKSLTDEINKRNPEELETEKVEE